MKQNLSGLFRSGTMRGAGLLFLAFIIAIADVHAAEVNFYLAPDGNDSWTGQLASANPGKTDGPFATLERARDAIRELRRAGKLDDSGVTVWVEDGIYSRRKTFELTAADSGTERSRVVYRAAKPHAAKIGGGVEVRGWTPVTNSAILARLDPNARAHVLQADLKAQGIENFGNMSRRGFGVGVANGPIELFFQDKPMTLARWPNEGWARIAGAPAGKDGGKFAYEGDRPKRWSTADDLWVHGYWTFDWADTYEKVRAIDVEKRVISTEPPHGAYGYTAGKRFYALNSIEELDVPGEWYLDRKTGILYFWPPAPIEAGHPVVSMLETPIVTIKDASFITLRELTFENARATGVVISGGVSNLIAGCVFHNLGTDAIGIQKGGKRRYNEQGSAPLATVGCGVVSCDIFDTSEGAIGLDGGDRMTLEPGGNFVVNCDIHHFNRWAFTYHPAVLVGGVGNRVAHNRLHDAPHNAVLFGGNDHLLEFNDVFRVCLETGDAGAFYTGRNLATRGTVIRDNYFHDIARTLETKEGFVDVMSVYLDDCACGTTIYGNIFNRGGRAAMIGGGRDNIIDNNIFVDCNPAVHIDARGEGWMKAEFENPKGTIQTTLREVPFNKAPYDRYPHMTNILEDRPAFPKYDRITRNICAGPKWIDFQDGLNESTVEVHDNFTSDDPGFVDRSHGDFGLRPDSPALKLGFKPIPSAEIGLFKDEYRQTK